MRWLRRERGVVDLRRRLSQKFGVQFSRDDVLDCGLHAVELLLAEGEVRAAALGRFKAGEVEADR